MKVSATTNSGGKPMSTTRTVPARSAPGSSITPTLAAPNVTVRSAQTASPSTAPVAPSTPDGMSTATTGAFAGVQRSRSRRPTRPRARRGTRSRRSRRSRRRRGRVPERDPRARTGGRAPGSPRHPLGVRGGGLAEIVETSTTPRRDGACPTEPDAGRRRTRHHRCSPCRTPPRRDGRTRHHTDRPRPAPPTVRRAPSDARPVRPRPASLGRVPRPAAGTRTGFTHSVSRHRDGERPRRWSSRG